MIVVMEAGATEEQIERVIERLLEFGFDVHRSTGAEMTILGALGVHPDFDPRQIELLEGVRQAARVTRPYRLAGRGAAAATTRIELPGGVRIGGREVMVAAGPARVETAELLEAIAAHVAAAGVRLLTSSVGASGRSPYARQGTGVEGLRLLREVANRHGLLVVSEVTRPEEVAQAAELADVLRVGGRNMQHADLLGALGRQPRPVLLERAPGATQEEWLLSAEHVLATGNPQVVLCERGTRSFDAPGELSLDVAALVRLRRLTHLPVFVDPGRATGRRDSVPAVACAAVAAGADGVVLELHPHPERARVGGARALTPETFSVLMARLRAVAAAIGRQMG